MDKPTRISNEKYNKILELSEKIKITRPSEGAVIHKLVMHIQEIYDYLDFIEKGEDTGLDDEALLRLGFTKNQIKDMSVGSSAEPARQPTPARSGRNSRPRISPTPIQARRFLLDDDIPF
jgi:hypothetical protein